MLVVNKFSSPNFSERAPERGGKISSVVLHYTNMRSVEKVIKRLCDGSSKARVSCHYLIGPDGIVFELVSPERSAWHAGVSCWRGEALMNDTSIGIEMHGFGDAKRKRFTTAQMSSLLDLLESIKQKYPGINFKTNLVSHSDIAPHRKQDIGLLFDWKGLSDNGFGVWHNVDTCNISGDAKLHFGGSDNAVLDVRRKLADIGYLIKDLQNKRFDSELLIVVRAFCRRFYPGALFFADFKGSASSSHGLSINDRFLATLDAVWQLYCKY